MNLSLVRQKKGLKRRDGKRHDESSTEASVRSKCGLCRPLLANFMLQPRGRFHTSEFTALLS